MPELPEVETTRRGIEPHVVGHTVARLVVRNPNLRWRVTPTLVRKLTGQTIRAVTRRGKYLLLATGNGTAILHLGMSGSLRVIPCAQAADVHDHVDIVLDNGDCLRLRDPRRFGALLRHLGPEPLGENFSDDYLFEKSRGRKRAIRDFLLDSHVVAGIGNIYANEALFTAGIRPTRAAGRVSREQYAQLARAIRATLNRALRAGGTTLRDFRNGHGEPGHFQLTLKVYGRAGAPCRACRTPVRSRRLGQRSAFFCPKCQH